MRCSKLIDDFLALAYWKERKLPVIVVRLFNTVGPRQTGQYGMVIPNFVRQALAGEPITVFGDGTQSRSFTYVGDVVRALVSLIDEPRAIGQVFNIGNGHEISIGDLAVKIKEMTGSSSEIVRIPYDQAYESGFEACRGECRTLRASRRSQDTNHRRAREILSGSSSPFAAVTPVMPGRQDQGRLRRERRCFRTRPSLSAS